MKKLTGLTKFLVPFCIIITVASLAVMSFTILHYKAYEKNLSPIDRVTLFLTEYYTVGNTENYEKITDVSDYAKQKYPNTFTDEAWEVVMANRFLSANEDAASRGGFTMSISSLTVSVDSSRTYHYSVDLALDKHDGSSPVELVQYGRLTFTEDGLVKYFTPDNIQALVRIVQENIISHR